MNIRLATIAAAALVAAPQADAQELRIGFINTLTGGAAIIGKQQVNGLKLGLEQQGWTKNGDKLGGVPMKLTIADDQRKPDVGLRAATRMVQGDKVHIVAGIIWSNVLLAVQKTVTRSKTILMSTNAGASPMAGRRCSKYFISTSFQNDQNAEAMGRLMNDEGLKNVFMMAPNYQAGKDNLTGFQRNYKGKVIGQILFKIGERDYQAHLSKVRAAKPDALFIFVPGGMGIAFMKQWAASGLGKSVKLFTVYAVDHMTLKPIGKAAVGTYHTNHWDPESKSAENQKFVKGYMAKHKAMPSFFAVQTYDAAGLIAAGVKAVKGKVDNKLALVRAMRKANYRGARGAMKYNVNGFLKQNYFRREVVLDSAGKPTIRTTGVVLAEARDFYWRKCPAKNRM